LASDGAKAWLNKQLRRFTADTLADPPFEPSR
jgi:hypothetical protein